MAVSAGHHLVGRHRRSLRADARSTRRRRRQAAHADRRLRRTTGSWSATAARALFRHQQGRAALAAGDDGHRGKHRKLTERGRRRRGDDGRRVAASATHDPVLSGRCQVARRGCSTLDGKPVGNVALPDIGTARRLRRQARRSRDLLRLLQLHAPDDDLSATTLTTGKSEVWAEPKLTFDPEDFNVEQRFYTSKDGTKVPMFIVTQEGRSTEPRADAALRLWRLQRFADPRLFADAARVDGAGRRARGRQHARRRRIRQGVARRRAARQQAERVRRFHRARAKYLIAQGITTARTSSRSRADRTAGCWSAR